VSWAVYYVRAGDTLWDIAQRYGVSVKTLVAANPQVGNPRLIHFGDQITVPPNDGAAPLIPAADATIVHSDLDGAGDLVVPGAVEVGFNHWYWPGELRGFYQFDLRGLPRDRLAASAHLMIRRNGTSGGMNGTSGDGPDPDLTLFAGAGTGSPEASDFTAGTLISAFEALGDFGSAGGICLDLTDTINRLRGDGADFITIVIRPNPLASTRAGTIGLSSSTDASYGFLPPLLALVGITMTGTVEEPWAMDGRLRLSITVTGLAPGEAVSLSASGKYHILEWICGTAPGPCGELGCGPSSYDKTEGTAKAATHVVAGGNGTAVAQIVLVAAPPAESCPTDSSSPWVAKHERWEKVSVADSAHGLLFTPDTIERAFTY
jgi:LysM repeat protein